MQLTEHQKTLIRVWCGLDADMAAEMEADLAAGLLEVDFEGLETDFGGLEAGAAAGR